MLERDARLRELAATAPGAWPEVALDQEIFVRYVRERLPESDDALDALRVADIYLACACALGNKTALGIFEQRYLAPLSRTLARFGDGGGLVADSIQQLRMRLFVGPEPRIREYTGRGSLDAWVKVAAVRLAVDTKRRERPACPDDEADAVTALGSAGDPELEVIKARYRGDFFAALHGAFEALDSDERRLLRFYVIDRMNIAEIGAVVGLSRATVARRIADCRSAILEETKKRLSARLNLKASELSSLIRLQQSDLDMSLSQLLRTRSE